MVESGEIHQIRATLWNSATPRGSSESFLFRGHGCSLVCFLGGAGVGEKKSWLEESKNDAHLGSQTQPVVLLLDDVCFDHSHPNEPYFSFFCVGSGSANRHQASQSSARRRFKEVDNAVGSSTFLDVSSQTSESSNGGCDSPSGQGEASRQQQQHISTCRSRHCLWSLAKRKGDPL